MILYRLHRIVFNFFLIFPWGSPLPRSRGWRNKCGLSRPVIIQGTCDLTLDLEGVGFCYNLNHWLRRLYRYSLSANKYEKNSGQNDLGRRNLHGQNGHPGLSWSRNRYYQDTAAALFSRQYTNRQALGQYTWHVITTQFLRRCKIVFIPDCTRKANVS